MKYISVTCIVWRLRSMVDMVKNLREPPIMWSIPFTLLLITLLLAAADTLFPFIPLEVGRHSWMWAASTLISAIIASLITEYVSRDNRKAMLSMGAAVVVFSLIYRGLAVALESSVARVVQGVIPNPFISMAVYTSLLTVIPSALTGAVLGGIFGKVEGTSLFSEKDQVSIAIPEEEEEHQPPGYEKLCNRCGHYAPFESKYCPFCGIELTMQRAPTVQYCRFCGARINYLGQFCPDCGKGIDIVSKPQVYVSR